MVEAEWSDIFFNWHLGNLGIFSVEEDAVYFCQHNPHCPVTSHALVEDYTARA